MTKLNMVPEKPKPAAVHPAVAPKAAEPIVTEPPAKLVVHNK